MNAENELVWKKVLNGMTELSHCETLFTLQQAVDAFEKSCLSRQACGLSRELSFTSNVNRTFKFSHIQVHLSYDLGQDGLAWDDDGQSIFVEIDLRCRLPFRWLWDEVLVLSNIKAGEDRAFFKEVRSTPVFELYADTYPLTSCLSNYGKAEALRMYSEMIPEMIKAGVFPIQPECQINK